jgi:hypothetical protein
VRTGLSPWRVRLGAIALAVWLGVSAVGAAELPAAASMWAPLLADDPASHWDARFGVFAHGLKGHETGTADLQVELASPRLLSGYGGFWSWFIPRLHGGGSLNTAGRTSFAYAGLLWTGNLTERLFFEPFVGAAVHDGVLIGPVPNMQALGCRELVHSGLSLGYRFAERWSVLATYEHLSNASSISGCRRNQALDNVGLRLGYLF